MKSIKQIYLPLFLLLGTLAFGQVGIGTETPHASAELELGSANKALLLNRVDKTDSIANPVNGMVIYDLSEECFKVFQDGAWTNCRLNAGSVATIDCSAALSPAATAGQTSYAGSFAVSYTGGNSGAYPAQTLTSSPAGFTATLAAGSFTANTGSVTYNVTAATVPAAGNYTFNITLGGQTCTKTITVTDGTAPGLLGTVTLVQNRKHFIASVYDTDYLPYEVPIALATTDVVNADGTPDAVTVDVQGTIPTTGITVQIPVASVTGSGNVLAYTSPVITVPANLTENGVAGQIQLSWAQQSYTTATKFVTATIKAIGSNVLPKKLDINAGIGNDYLGILLGTLKYPYNNAGTITNYEVRDIPGIPDRMFGQTDNAGSSTSHNFLYLPVQGEDGNIWLNNNLGANYSNINHSSFNLAQQATSVTDYHAYGNLLQWGRLADGHDLINWTSPSSGVPVHPYITGTSNTDRPTIPNYLRNGTNWLIPYDTSLWLGESSKNNPCPNGFRVPSITEFSTLKTLSGDALATVSPLKFTVAGYNVGSNPPVGTGYYWTSTGTFNNYNRMIIGSSPGVNLTGTEPASYAFSVRCIQN